MRLTGIPTVFCAVVVTGVTSRESRRPTITTVGSVMRWTSGRAAATAEAAGSITQAPTESQIAAVKAAAPTVSPSSATASESRVPVKLPLAVLVNPGRPQEGWAPSGGTNEASVGGRTLQAFTQSA